MADRAVVFIDGNNWFHSLKNIGVADRGRLNYRKISKRLIGPRDWVGTRYYSGRVRQKPDKALYAAQRRFLSSLSATDKRITFRLGRLEPRRVDDPAANVLGKYLANLSTRIDPQVYKDLNQIARDHQSATALVEKAVDARRRSGCDGGA